MKRFPAEFEALLTPAGRRLLAGKHPAHRVLLRDPFYSTTELIDAKRLTAFPALLAKAFDEQLALIERQLPPSNSAPEANNDTLPKVGRLRSVAVFDAANPAVNERAQDIGLHQLFFSQSFHAFCEALAGELLDGPQGAQVMCFQQGDYAGPHTDHHPQLARTRDGYVDVHLTISTGGVKEQFLVYERDGHFSQQRSIAASGTINAYRLPVWHYTTPLLARSKRDRRWLLLRSNVLQSTRHLEGAPSKGPNRSADFEAALQKVLLRVSASATSAAPSASEAPPPSGSAPARQSGDS